jgi:hypothetical protein
VFVIESELKKCNVKLLELCSYYFTQRHKCVFVRPPPYFVPAKHQLRTEYPERCTPRATATNDLNSQSGSVPPVSSVQCASEEPPLKPNKSSSSAAEQDSRLVALSA